MLVLKTLLKSVDYKLCVYCDFIGERGFKQLNFIQQVRVKLFTQLVFDKTAFLGVAFFQPPQVTLKLSVTDIIGEGELLDF